MVNVWLAYQGITSTAKNQADLYNYLNEEMIDNTYDRFMMWSAEGKRRTIVESNDETIDDNNPLFCRINGAPRWGITLHVTPNNNRKKRRYGTETKYLLQGEWKVYRKKTTIVCSDCAATDAVKNEM